jgi:hypothetical protein
MRTINVFDEQALLPGERKLGQYQVAIARYTTPSGWSPTVPPISALVTNYRLVLQPQTRRPYTPASIPSTYITKVGEVDLGQYHHGVRICLKTGHELYLLISWSQGNAMTHSLETMLTSPVGITLKLNTRDLNRLIRFISGL